VNTITVRAEITKSCKRGWSCTTHTKYPDWSNETVTVEGRETLASVLWHLVLTCLDWRATLATVQVKGKPMPRAEIYQRIHKALAGSCLSYRLPAIREYLLSQEITNEQD